MASFKKIQERLCLCLIEEITGEEEFVLLSEANRPSNLPFPHSAYERFSLANKDPVESKTDFRVEKRDIPSLIEKMSAVGSNPSCFFLGLKFLLTLVNKIFHVVSNWPLISSEFRHSAFVQSVCYFFQHAASFCWTFLSCIGIYIDDFSAWDAFMVICPKHYWVFAVVARDLQALLEGAAIL